MQFSELNLNPKILSGLTKMGYVDATPIQEQVIQSFTSGQNIVGQSQTGTGKTAAFALPILNAIDPQLKSVQAIVLCPTRELAVQTREEFFNLSQFIFVRSLAVYGGSSIFRQKQELQFGPQVLVGTPGRVIDLIQRGYLRTDSIKYFVLDEVDRMLDMGFVDDVDWIRSQLKNLKQTMSFSATITSELKSMIHKYLGEDYATIKIQQDVVVDKIDHAFVQAPHFEKMNLLTKWIQDHADHKIIVFTQTKHATTDLQGTLQRAGFSCGALHGDIQQSMRLKTLEAYKTNKIKILVATDVASRGLNMKDIDLVVNYDVPHDPESYVHRIGRTARAGKEGKAIMFVSPGEEMAFRQIERRNKITIKKVDRDGVEMVRSDDRNDRGGRSFGGGRGGSRSGSARRVSFARGGSYQSDSSPSPQSSGGRSYEGASSGGRSYEGASRGYRSPETSDGGRGGQSRGGYSSGGYAGRSESSPRNESATKHPGGYTGRSFKGYGDSSSSFGNSSGGYKGRSEGSSSGGYKGRSEGSSSGGYRGNRTEGSSSGGYKGRTEGSSSGGYKGANKGPSTRKRS